MGHGKKGRRGAFRKKFAPLKFLFFIMEPFVTLRDNNLFRFLYKIVGTKSGTDCGVGRTGGSSSLLFFRYSPST